MKEEESYSKECDIFALGILYIKLLTNKNPFKCPGGRETKGYYTKITEMIKN